jgi:hypothetical protein
LKTKYSIEGTDKAILSPSRLLRRQECPGEQWFVIGAGFYESITYYKKRPEGGGK